MYREDSASHLSATGAQPRLDGFCRSLPFWQNREKRALHGLGQPGHHILHVHVGVQRKHLPRSRNGADTAAHDARKRAKLGLQHTGIRV